MHGSHLIKSWSVNQSVIALSSGEAEYYASVKSASIAMGIQSLCKDLGVEFDMPIDIKSDASAAIGICNRIGLGKVRHIEVNQLWLQEKVTGGKITVTKVGTLDNLADAMTKAIDHESMQTHLIGIDTETREDRHHLTPRLEMESEWQEEGESEEQEQFSQ